MWKSRNVTYLRYFACHSHFATAGQVNFLSDPFLQTASFSLLQIYEDYHFGFYFPPIYLKKINDSKGYGVFADEDIPANTFICEYGGDIIPETLSHLKPEYNMKLKYGSTPLKSMIITVLKHASLGPLLNHPDDGKPNCKIIRLYLFSMVRVIIYTCRKIHKNEELTYNYNSG